MFIGGFLPYAMSTKIVCIGSNVLGDNFGQYQMNRIDTQLLYIGIYNTHLYITRVLSFASILTTFRIFIHFTCKFWAFDMYFIYKQVAWILISCLLRNQLIRITKQM